MEAATGEWILEVDADERVTPELRREIETFLEAPPEGFDMAALPLRNVFLGRRLDRSAKYPAYRYRLFRKDSYRHNEERTVHEGLWSNGPVWPFQGDLEHMLAASMHEAVSDAHQYARLELQQLAARVTPATLARGMVVRPASKFLYRTFLDSGWRDGWPGLVKISLDCWSDALVWALRLREKHREKTGSRPRRHFAGVAPAQGPVKIVGIAGSPKGVREGGTWLDQARQAGADTALVSATSPAGTTVRTRTIAGFGPLRVLHALDAERQLRAFDAIVSCDSLAQALTRGLPRRLRGRTAPLTLAVPPEEAVRMVTAVTRRKRKPGQAASAVPAPESQVETVHDSLLPPE